MRTPSIAIAIAAAVAGCSTYARVAHTNAPGVIDISTPPERENGSDDLFVLPATDKPGASAYVAWLHPAFSGGQVRRGAGFEFSFGVSIEKDSDDKGAMMPMQTNAWGVSLGMGIAQFRDPPGPEENSVVDAPGPISLEAYYRRFIVMFAAGPVVYPDTRDVGVQVTIHAPLTQLRARYVQDSGFELMLAWDLNFPLVFGWSR